LSSKRNHFEDGRRELIPEWNFGFLEAADGRIDEGIDRRIPWFRLIIDREKYNLASWETFAPIELLSRHDVSLT